MKVVNCTKCNEEYAIDLNKPEEWYCPYCDNLYSVTTDKLSVEKLQEQLNTAKKALTEISKTKDFYRSGRDHWEEFSQDALKAQKALAAIGKGENNEI